MIGEQKSEAITGKQDMANSISEDQCQAMNLSAKEQIQTTRVEELAISGFKVVTSPASTLIIRMQEVKEPSLDKEVAISTGNF